MQKNIMGLLNAIGKFLEKNGHFINIYSKVKNFIFIYVGKKREYISMVVVMEELIVYTDTWWSM